MKTLASETFHHPDYKHNCAQAIANKWKELFEDEETIVDQMKANGGGRAPEGLCGAIYAAMQAVPADKRDDLLKAFEQRVGQRNCLDIKKVAKVPCVTCINVADELLEEYQSKK